MKNRKKMVVISLVILVCAGLIYFYKWKQKEFLGLSSPQIESAESIKRYAEKNKLEGNIMMAESKKSQDVLSKYFSYGMIYVLSGDSTLLDCNIETYGGSCYQDVEDKICNGFSFVKKNFRNRITGRQIIDTLFAYSKFITTKDSLISPPRYKYIVIYSWVKYAKASIDETSTRFLKCINQDSVLLLSVNTDYVGQ